MDWINTVGMSWERYCELLEEQEAKEAEVIEWSPDMEESDD